MTTPDTPTTADLDLAEHFAAWEAGEDPAGHYEMEADLFYSATRLMAPGKSAPYGGGGGDEERRAAWTAWMRDRRAVYHRTVLHLVRTAREAKP